MDRMTTRRKRTLGWLPPALRRLEHRLGAQRDDRTLWVWLVPAATVVVTFLVLVLIGMQGKVDPSLSVPMAFALSSFLGTLSAVYLTVGSADEHQADDRDDPRAPPEPRPTTRPPGGVEVSSVVLQVSPGRATAAAGDDRAGAGPARVEPR